MRVLGIDPGFHVTGYSIVQKELQRTTLVDCGFLKMNPSKHLAERVLIFHTYFSEKITQFNITDLALETPFLGKNAQNFLKLGYLRGILYLLSATHGLTLHEFAPTQVKQTLTGFGGASKEQVARVIAQLFPGLPAQEKADVTDAIAVSLCGVWQNKQLNQLRTPTFGRATR